MSNNKKKALLNETTTRRFWKLAGLQPIHEKAYVFGEEEEIEEGMSRATEDDKEEVEEARGKSNPVGGTLPDGTKGFGPVYKYEPKDDDEASEKVGDATVTPVKVRKMNEEEVENIEEMGMDRAAEDEPEMEMGAEEGPEDGQDVEVDVPEGDVASLRTARDILDQILSAVDGADAEPEMEDEPEMDAEEPAMDDEEPALQEIDQEELEEVAERIASRVAKRIAESLKRK